MIDFGQILIVGSAGQVGLELQRSFAGAGNLLCYDRAEVDLADPDQVRSMVRATAPDLILNAAAYTAVDRAESEPELAMAINAVAPSILAEEAALRGKLLVHYSTDYVFDGSKPSPWVEDDQPHPLNEYGRSKLAGEVAVRESGAKYLAFRTSWVYGPHGNNFLLTMLRQGRERKQLSVVDDQMGAPTTSIALAEATRAIVERALSGSFGPSDSWSGLYHMTCAGSTSWCGFAREIFTRGADLFAEPAPELIPISSADYVTAAKRPENSVLSNEKLNRRFGIELPTWTSALDRVLETLRAER